MIIDVIGPNAAGKTTLLRKRKIKVPTTILLPAATEERVTKIPDVEGWEIDFLAEWPQAFDMYEKYFPRREKKGLWVREGDFRAVQNEVKLRALRSESYFHPKRGILKMLAEICVHSGLRLYEREKLLRAWPLPDLVVAVNVDKDEGWERVRVRDRLHASHRESYDRQWGRFQSLFPIVEKLASERGVEYRYIET